MLHSHANKAYLNLIELREREREREMDGWRMMDGWMDRDRIDRWIAG